MTAPNGNFYVLLRARGLRAGEAPCLTVGAWESLSYRALHAMAAQMADVLASAGLRPGDRVVAQVEKSVANVALYLGALFAGGVYVPLNTGYTAEETAYFLGDAAPAVFVCDPGRLAELSPHARQAGVGTVFTLDREGGGALIDAARRAPCDTVVAQRGEDDLAAILYTSGTTGRSKGAMLTHGNLASNAVALNRLWGFSSDDVLLHALPVFHIHGLFVALHVAMLSGCEILFHKSFDAGAVRESLARATVMMGVPTFYARLLARDDFRREDAAHMRLFISGSAPLTQETFNAFEARTGHRILERYGMSEAGMIASNPLDEEQQGTQDGASNGARRAGTVGFPLPGVSVRIAPPDEGSAASAQAPTDAAPGATPPPGEVEIKGPNVFKGYWRNPEKTAEAFTPDGYFRTGDIGMLDGDGRLSLVGRAKDLIIAGGYNIYPKEIEQVLDALPGVAESAVVGAPHPDLGEGAIAVLVAAGDPPTDDEIAAALSRLARFKRPRRLYYVDALPRNAMGKVQKHLLRATYREAFSA